MVMDVIYVDENEKNQIVNHKVTDQETIDLLLSKGIYVRNSCSDENALEILRTAYNETVGRIQILYLILTNSCNLNCTYCFLENNPQYKEQRSVMSDNTAIMAVEKFCTYVNHNKIKSPLIVLYGGEPLLNFELIKTVINYTKKHIEDMQFSLITNGTLITDEICAFLKANNVNIGISIDGIKNLHDNNRPFKKDGKGSFDATNQGRKLLERNGNNYGLSMTVSPDFLSCQDEVMEWLSSENVNNIFYNLYHFSSSNDSWEEVAKKTVQFLTKSYDTFSASSLAEGRIQRQIDSIVENKFLFSDCGAVGCEQFAVMPNVLLCQEKSQTKQTKSY